MTGRSTLGGPSPEANATQTSTADIVHRLATERVIPVATIDDAEDAEAICRALLAGGISCIEITFRTAGAAETIRRARQVKGMLVGAGTVLSPQQMAAAVDAGAQFAVAPGLNPDVVAEARQLGMPFFPGVATPSEIETARGLGLGAVKVFPAAAVGGPAFLWAVAATYPEVRFIPTGGITLTNVMDYLAVPSVVAVGGSWLVKDDLLQAGRFDAVTRLAGEVKAVLS
jgi:2-dehydro-3-deoxyphosphogluconate aldolase/(4S)-4-hydroxy-2-oxoglutarate aldolase